MYNNSLNVTIHDTFNCLGPKTHRPLKFRFELTNRNSSLTCHRHILALGKKDTLAYKIDDDWRYDTIFVVFFITMSCPKLLTSPDSRQHLLQPFDCRLPPFIVSWYLVPVGWATLWSVVLRRAYVEALAVAGKNWRREGASYRKLKPATV